MSEQFNDFLGFLIIIGFAIVFWNAFKAGKITENTTTITTPTQTISQDQNASAPNTTVYPNGPIQSVQYIPAQ